MLLSLDACKENHRRERKKSYYSEGDITGGKSTKKLASIVTISLRFGGSKGGKIRRVLITYG